MGTTLPPQAGTILPKYGRRAAVANSSACPTGISLTDTLVATASKDHTARVWETSSGKQIARFTHDESVSAIAFSPDGKYLATASMDGIARLWLWRSEDLLIEAQARLTRNLTPAEWQQYLGEEPYRKTCPNLPEEAYTEGVRL